MAQFGKNLSLLLVLGLVATVLVSLCDRTYAQDDSEWHFQLAPYAWLAGQHGTMGTLPGLPAVDIDVDFWDDILGNINGALMLVGEARKGRLGMLADVVYTDIEASEETPGPFYSSISSRTKSWLITGTVFYRVVEKDRAFLDILGGIRFWSVDSELTLGQGLIRQRKISNKHDWLDPIMGVKGLLPLGRSNFFLSGSFLIGGLNLGSDFLWDGNLGIGYQWTPGIATTIGYRYLSVDYEKDGFKYDAVQDGLIFGFSFRF